MQQEESRSYQRCRQGACKGRVKGGVSDDDLRAVLCVQSCGLRRMRREIPGNCVERGNEWRGEREGRKKGKVRGSGGKYYRSVSSTAAGEKNDRAQSS